MSVCIDLGWPQKLYNRSFGMSSDSVSSEALAAAVERRTRQLPAQPSAAQLAAEHERRQAFRRLIDPGIVRPNTKEQAAASLKVQLCFMCLLMRL